GTSDIITRGETSVLTASLLTCTVKIENGWGPQHVHLSMSGGRDRWTTEE
ncbi:hypothetical protein BgiBS90_014549, partial [Biomphalaria glabrata]